MSVLDNFDSFKSFLGDRLNQAEGQGMNKNSVNEIAYEIGDYLSNNVDAKNDQETVLHELWSVADNKEQHAIANMMVKLVQNNGNQQ
ncbi:DUF3243 domain-containing protein [Halobacillus amylolyticus]|uniref:DUF3243 domain-containing protein n=1 Tax=Halobacillus amylolyticus TaxID=2932259 RepID=A0ABY4HFJ0_9BACI|nr:DUF3243 domain-containing protein [Halobacillus amylolyticus]UOR12660.1 DUF3243 domain-containing protein [Halobacillus amylolyticus]